MKNELIRFTGIASKEGFTSLFKHHIKA